MLNYIKASTKGIILELNISGIVKQLHAVKAIHLLQKIWAGQQG